MTEAAQGKNLITRKRVIYASVVGFLAALIYLLVPPVRYQYTTDLYLGESLVAATFQPIENTLTVVAMIKDSILPSPDAELQRLGIVDLDGSVLLLVVDNGRAIRLRSDGPESDFELIGRMHRFVADRALDHLKRREVFLRNRAQGRLQIAKQSLETSTKNLGDYSADIAHAASDEAALTQEIKALSDEISDEEKRKSESQSSAPAGRAQGEDEAFAFGRRGQLARYKQLKLSALPARITEIEKLGVEVNKAAMELRQRIDDLNIEIASIDPPRITRFVERSIRPVGPRKLVRLAGGFIAGFSLYFVALMLAGFAKRQYSSLKA
jgi:hypothetical protein